MSDLPTYIRDVPTPSFLVDIDKLKKNCESMSARCHALGVNLRPHMKTHKTVEAAEIATGGTKRRISVSTVEEVRFYANAGFEDILYAIIITEEKAKRLEKYANQLDVFHVLFDSMEGIRSLQNFQLKNGKKWSVLLKIDVGYHRAGVSWDNDERVVALAREAANSNNIHFEGLYSHCGQSYELKSGQTISDLEATIADRFTHVRDRLRENDIVCHTIGTGSTPLCSSVGAKKNSVFTEFHPGCYVFNDFENVSAGSCSKDDVAVCVATRVIGSRPDMGYILVDCGSLALSHSGIGQNDGQFCYFKGHPELRMRALTQEYGKVECTTGNIDFKQLSIGSMLFVLPWNACVTAAGHPSFFVHSGEKIIGQWKPTRGW